ncbi:MAG: ABC transporter permease [Actinomycetota bacterium]|nr:ABC transporter permease [Actinomycetota bacterium]
MSAITRDRAKGPGLRRIAHEIGPPLAGITGLIAAWALIAALTTTEGVPSPLETWNAFVAGISNGTIPEATAKTLIRLVFAFSFAVGFGTMLGVGLALNEFGRRSIRPLVVALQIVPFVAWVPIAVIWFGPTERAVVFVTVVGSFPSMTLATMASMRQVPPILRRAGRTLGAEGWSLYREVVLPAALPGFLAGLQQAWGFAWKALMTAELIIAAAGAIGLGHLLADEADDMPALVAVVAVIAVIGVMVEYLVFNRLDRRVRRRRGLLLEG